MRLVKYCSNFAWITIPDNDPDQPAIGAMTITDDDQILDANVRLTITHPWVGDLNVRLSTLTSGGIGITIPVVNRSGHPLLRLGCSGNHYRDLILDDEGLHGDVENQCGDNPVNVPGNCYVPGDPPGSYMQGFDGRTTKALWRLYVSDYSPFQTGRLEDFCVEFLVPAHPPTPTPPGGQDVTYCSSFAPILIPDGGLPVTGTISIPDTRTILDMNVVLTATHHRVGDLNVSLSNGTTPLTLVDRPGVPESQYGCEENHYYGLILDDEGHSGEVETLCNPQTPTNGEGSRYIVGDPPNPAAFTAYDGSSAAGTWTITASDEIEGGTGLEVGFLEGFCLNLLVQGTTATPVASVTPSATIPTGTRTSTPTGTPPTLTPTPSVTPSGGTPTATMPPSSQEKLYLQLILRGS